MIYTSYVDLLLNIINIIIIEVNLCIWYWATIELKENHAFALFFFFLVRINTHHWVEFVYNNMFILVIT